jgi:HSP90 family molecular chaperone
LKFLLETENNASAQDLICQFGVGFYSAFLLAKKIVVQSKRYDEKQYVNLGRGTKETLHVLDDVQFLEFSNTTRVREISTKYS